MALGAGAATDVWATIADEAACESDLWAEALLPLDRRETVAVFSPLAAGPFALGLETIYEGYLLHYGRPRVFGPADGDTAVLLGDYLYAHGLVRIAELGDVDAVAALADLIAHCAHLRAEGLAGDGAAWAATAATVGEGVLDAARDALRSDGDASPLLALARREAGADAVEAALAAHAARMR